MKRLLPHFAVGLGVALSSIVTIAATTANGPYYATPSWDQTLPAATRFIVLTNFSLEAVLDRETGLVWERAPSRFAFGDQFEAHNQCNNRRVGARKGWRLPTLQELSSLLDPFQVNAAQDNVALPAGHPFLGVNLNYFWSATSGAANANEGWTFFWGDGQPRRFDKASTGNIWCVRGGQGVDAQ